MNPHSRDALLARLSARPEWDIVIIGGGATGLGCAVDAAARGYAVLLVEARPGVGGTATSERFAGAIVNICNCDHLTFRTTPVIAPMKASRNEKKRGTGSAADM